MVEIGDLLILVNTGPESSYNQYAAYVAAFLAKQIGEVENVTVFYGPQGVEMSKEGTLADFPIEDSVKELVSSQVEGLSADDLPYDLESLARYEKDELGINIYSCGTFHVIDGFAESIEDKSEVENFIDPIKLPQATETLLSVDRIIYY